LYTEVTTKRTAASNAGAISVASIIKLFVTINLSPVTFALSVRWLEKLFLTKGEFYRVSSLSSTILPGKMGFIKDE
jgi:hypothetical protein